MDEGAPSPRFRGNDRIDADGGAMNQYRSAIIDAWRQSSVATKAIFSLSRNRDTHPLHMSKFDISALRSLGVARRPALRPCAESGRGTDDLVAERAGHHTDLSGRETQICFAVRTGHAYPVGCWRRGRRLRFVSPPHRRHCIGCWLNFKHVSVLDVLRVQAPVSLDRRCGSGVD